MVGPAQGRIEGFDLRANLPGLLAQHLHNHGQALGAHAFGRRGHAERGQALAAALSRFGRVDQLVNNAGIVKPAPFLEISEANWDQIIDINLKGALLDVFDIEPLPDASPLWTHPGILVTPHYGSTPSRRDRARKTVEIIHRWERGETLDLLYDRQRGY